MSAPSPTPTVTFELHANGSIFHVFKVTPRPMPGAPHCVNVYYEHRVSLDTERRMMHIAKGILDDAASTTVRHDCDQGDEFRDRVEARVMKSLALAGIAVRRLPAQP
jgi:hypothetical protein